MLHRFKGNFAELPSTKRTFEEHMGAIQYAQKHFAGSPGPKNNGQKPGIK